MSPATITLDDPDRRNALGMAMFDFIDDAIARATGAGDPPVLLIQGEGPVFCAGFDLAAAVEDASRMSTYIHRLSRVLRALRRYPMPVVAAVQGAAIAGGCAMLTACDVVIVSRTAKLGYPVHAIGVSPAVTIPTLAQMIGTGQARSLLVSGQVITGERAHAIGLATHLSESDDAVRADGRALAASLAEKPRHALRVTKDWINRIDGSLDDGPFDAVATASADASDMPIARALLRSFWEKRTEGVKK